MVSRRAIAVLAAVLTGATAAPPVARFLGSLSPALRDRAQISFSDDERFNWHYVPRSRRGVAIGDLSESQRDVLHEILRSGLSEAGFRKATGIVELEPILGRIEGNSFRDPDRYFFSVFGDPARHPWGWRFEGHHLSLHMTASDRGVSVTPMFLGANPARVPGGNRAGWEVLADEQSLGRALVKSLDEAQRKRAVIRSRAPADIVTGTDRTFDLDGLEGLPASGMSSEQRALLLRLIAVYVGKAPEDVAKREMAKLDAAGSGLVHFAWAGGLNSGEPHYYRIHGPTILIEYDNTQDGANHIHTVWRNPAGDFGDDLLARHYAFHHH